MVKVIVRAIIAHDGRHLLVKLRGEDFWCLPGGKAEDTEEIQDALKREIVEELGVEPRIGRLLYVHQLINPTKGMQRLEFFFEVTNGADYTKIDISATPHGAQELAAAEFIDLASERVLPAFLAKELPLQLETTIFKTSMLVD